MDKIKKKKRSCFRLASQWSSLNGSPITIINVFFKSYKILKLFSPAKRFYQFLSTLSQTPQREFCRFNVRLYTKQKKKLCLGSRWGGGGVRSDRVIPPWFYFIPRTHVSKQFWRKVNDFKTDLEKFKKGRRRSLERWEEK